MVVAVKGVVERITYNNEEDGYSVIQLKVPGKRDLVTAVGSFASLAPGEVLKMEGSWGVHPRYGEQFKVERYESAAPATLQGIQKYLGSGLIKGIGPVMARRIVGLFGTETLDVIDTEDLRLLEVDGIGKVRLDQIRRAWADQKEIRDLMVFLQGHGISPVYATRIYKQYGGDARRMVQENPYRLATDITGIGFLTADRIALKMGFSHDSVERAEAGLLYAAQHAADEGHVCLPQKTHLERAQAHLEIPPDVLETALPENLLSEFKLLQRTQGLSFTGFMAKLDDRFSKGQPMMARKKLDRVELPEKGKIRTQEFKTFEIRFSDALKNIHDMGPEEARRILLCKMPDWMRVWILEEEAKKNAENPVLIFGGVPGMTEAQATQTIQSFIGEAPTAIRAEATPGQFLIQLRNLDVARKLIGLQGRSFRRQALRSRLPHLALCPLAPLRPSVACPTLLIELCRSGILRDWVGRLFAQSYDPLGGWQGDRFLPRLVGGHVHWIGF